MIQFSISTQFKCSYGLVVKTFQFQAIQFSETIQFSISISLVVFNPLIGPLSGATTPDQSGPGAMVMKGCSAFPKAPASLEPHHEIV